MGDFISRMGEQEMGPKSGSILPETGELIGLVSSTVYGNSTVSVSSIVYFSSIV